MATTNPFQGGAQSGLNARIALAADRGQITSLDRAAMNNALSAIKRDFASGGLPEGTARLTPLEMRSRIETLIDAQVAGGTLSQAQGAQLRGFYSATPVPEQTSGGADDEEPPPPPPPPPPPASKPDRDLLAQPAPDALAQTRDDSGLTPTAGDELDALVQFMNLLRDKLSVSRSGYGSAASTYPVRRSPLVVDTLA